MDGVGGTVSHKIKAAIKAKLIELEAYVDDELPDYIMVMVANKRNRKQMENDLSLFLNNNTKVFTAWLHTVLQKLQEVTVAAKDKNKKDKERSPKKTSSKKRSLSRDSSKSKDRSKKKHSKKHKTKKSKKKLKRSKSQDKVEIVGSDVKSPPTQELSDWENDGVDNKSDAKNNFDVSKEIGRAIIGTLKEKHKNDSGSENIEERSRKKDGGLEPSVEANNESTPVDCSITSVAQQPDDFLLEPPLEKALSTTEDVCFIVDETPKSMNGGESTVMAPTKALLMEHDKITKESTEVTIEEVMDTRAVSHVSSDSSVSPEELRRELLLSRTKKKMEERNLESRMRSNSPEVVFVEEKMPTKPDSRSFDIEPKPADLEMSVEPDRHSEPKSPHLSLRASSFGSPDRKGSPPSQRRKDRRSQVMVPSRVVAPSASAPDPPGVLSMVHVRPREFDPPDKQANKNLILRAVAAAEKSVASAPLRKEPSPTPPVTSRPKALFTKNLRRKRYENFEVTLPNESRVDPACTNKESDENFISSKKDGKDINSSYIQCWLNDVEEAGKNEELIKPNEIEEPIELSEDGKDFRSGSDDEPLKDGDQIVVTVDGPKKASSRSSKTGNKSENSTTISDRFGNIAQDNEDHEFKEKFREFERKRIEKKESREGRSNNKKLIAQLSMKFGQIDRVFDDEVNLGVRRRLPYLNRAFEDVEKGLRARDDDKDGREEKRLAHSSIDNGDRAVKRRLDSRDLRYELRQHADNQEGSTKRIGRSYKDKDRRSYHDTERRRSELDSKSTERNETSSDLLEENHKRYEQKKRRISHSDKSEDNERDSRRRRSSELTRKRERSDDGSPQRDKKGKRSVRVTADESEDVLKERCKFWPECARGSSCEFHHPTSICKLLPHCKFKDRCLYIHPLCRNDRECSLSDCAYEHSSQRRSGPTAFSSSKLCKYDSYCRNPECKYQHSDASCKFGSRCTNSDCPFVHSTN